MSTSCCSYCKKECKSSDSRPYPTSKSKDRIHNKCHIKKSLSDKKQLKPDLDLTSITDTVSPPSSTISTASSIMDRMAKEESDMAKASNERKLAKLMDEQSKQTTDTQSNNSGQFFFDLKAGIAKPHEKKQYLHHRNLSEMVARFDDNGFKDEASGRAYDHTGRDLNTLGDSDEETSQKEEQETSSSNTQTKKRRSYEERPKSTKVKLDEHNPCWFCLSSPKVEKHLIVAIGEFCYLTLAKGGLCDDHLLLLPIDHIQCLNDSAANSNDLLAELESFKRSLIDYFNAKAMGVIFFERNFRSVHWQLQVVPVPLKTVDGIEERIKLVSKSYFQNSKYHDIPSNCSLGDIIPSRVPYIFWQIEPIGSRFVMQIQVEGSFFPVQFGRLVLSHETILNCPEKVDWKKCTMKEDEYRELVQQIKSGYEKFDFT